MKPMPRLGPMSKVGDGAHVQLEGSLAYPVARALLAKVLVGREFEQSGRKLKVADIDVMGIGGGRVALGITLEWRGARAHLVHRHAGARSRTA